MGITYRSEKGSPLTIEELDNNFRHFTGSRSITGSLTVSGSVTTADASGSLGSNEQPWKDLYLSPDSIVFTSGSISASLSYPSQVMSGSSTTGTLRDNGGGLTILYSGSLLTGVSSSDWASGSLTGRISTTKTSAQQGGYHEFHFSYRDKYGYPYDTGSNTLFGLITSSARESDSFLVRIYSNEAPNKSVFYTNSGSVEIGNINPTTGEGDLIAFLRPIGGYSVQFGYPVGSELNGNVNVSFQVSKTAPFTYTDSGSFLVSASSQANTITFTTLDGNTFDVEVSASGAADTIYSADGVLTDNRTVDLSGSNLTFDASSGENFTINLDNSASVKIPNLLSASSANVIAYNTSSGQLSYIDTGSLNISETYTYVPSIGDSNSQISGSATLRLVDADAIYGGSSFPTITSNRITIQQNGIYKIEYNAMISGSTSGTSNSWWKVQLALNQGGITSYPVSNYAVKSNLEPYYGSTHLLYIGNLNANDVISFIGDTTDSSINHLRGRAFVRKIS
jgi:hypothetical protein